MFKRNFRAGVSCAVLGLLLMWASGLLAQERQLTQRVIQSGHSLTDGILSPLREMVKLAGNGAAVIDKATGAGSPIEWRWHKRLGGGQPDARYDIKNYDTLVLTERVSLSNTLTFHGSTDYALRFFTNAWDNGNDGKGAETILYATWVDVRSGPDFENPYKDAEGHIAFRDRLPLEMERWEVILDYVNENRPDGSPQMRMIPGPQLMAAIYDEIEVGNAPRLADITDLFHDNIHLNALGNYYIALAHFAVIYDRDPRGVQNLGGATPEQARWMQELVWSVLSR
jgi:hypothetical protein